MASLGATGSFSFALLYVGVVALMGALSCIVILDDVRTDPADARLLSHPRRVTRRP